MAAKVVAIKPAPRHQSAFVAQCSVSACQRIRSKKKRRHEEPDRKRDQHRVQRVAHREAQKFAAALARERCTNLFRISRSSGFRRLVRSPTGARGGHPTPPLFILFLTGWWHCTDWLAAFSSQFVCHTFTGPQPLWFRQACIRSPLSALPASAA